MPSKKRKLPDGPGPSGGKKPRFRYTEDAMTLAIKAVRERNFKTRQAAREFGVPFSTLQAKIKGKYPEGRRMGPKTVLTTEEENILASYIVAKAKKGFPLQKRTLVETVKNIVTEDQRETPFTNNKPGNSWIAGFFKRHPQITQRHAEVINRGRASVTEQKIRAWGNDLKEYLKEENSLDILEDPTRIFNADESGFRTNPDTGLVLGPINYENFYIVKDGSEKENISTLVTVSAAGEVVPPCIVFPYVRVPREIAQNCHPDWNIGRSTSGWMTGQVFFGYIGNTFIPWLKEKKVKFPVLLLIDGHRSHLTLNVCRLCEANDIILYALLPNATHIIQPLDVSAFKALKSGWKTEVEDWKAKTNNRVVTRAKFPDIFEKVLNEKATPLVIQNGFRKCGIYPFNLDKIDYSKCMNHASRISEVEAVPNKNFVSAKPTEFGVEHLLYIESCMDGSRAEDFRTKESTGWDGDESARELFNLWKKLRNRCMQTKDSLEKEKSGKGESELEGEKEREMDNVENGENERENESGVVSEETGQNDANELEKTMEEELNHNDEVKEQKSVREPDETNEEEKGNGEERKENDNTETKIVKTPVKIPQCKHNISPAFLGNVVWPTESPGKKTKPNGKKERLPHAASSKKWLKYWEGVDEARQKKLEEKERKAKERKEKKEKKEKNGEASSTSKKDGDLKIKSKNKKDWKCPKCKGSYNKDVAMCNGRVWVGPCNQCDNWYHKKCVSKKILSEFGLTDTDLDEETDFVCDVCFGDTDDEDAEDFLARVLDENSDNE